jgi:hypothetical protein
MRSTLNASLLHLIILALLVGCASTGHDNSVNASAPADTSQLADNSGSGRIIYNPAQKPVENVAPKESKSPMKSKVTLDVAAGIVSDAIRAVGAAHGGNLVLMSGAEPGVVPAQQFKRAELSQVATRIAAAANLAVQETPDYYFLFLPGYEPLVDVSLTGAIPQEYGRQRTDVTFGYGLRLYTAFAWMSYALDRSIVADNSIADARCGELALQHVPLESAIEAILKSARVNSYALDSTDEYIFIHVPSNTSPPEALLNANPLEENQRQLLDRTVSLVLPNAPSPGKPLEMQQHTSQLGEVLESISQQLGVTVVAESGLEKLPVNPVVMTNVRLSTALDLVIRQWLIPNYGYQVTHDRIVIRTRQSQ